MTPGEQRWAEIRESNPSTLPWKKLSAKVRGELEAYALGGCGCGHCCTKVDGAMLAIGSDGNSVSKLGEGESK